MFYPENHPRGYPSNVGYGPNDKSPSVFTIAESLTEMMIAMVNEVSHFKKLHERYYNEILGREIQPYLHQSFVKMTTRMISNMHYNYNIKGMSWSEAVLRRYMDVYEALKLCYKSIKQVEAKTGFVIPHDNCITQIARKEYGEFLIDVQTAALEKQMKLTL